MNPKDKNLQELLALANLYPSPHNGQPISLKQVSGTDFKLYFHKERGLQSTEISYIFSFVSMGVFMQHLALSAQALGHTLTHKLQLPKGSDLRGKGAVLFATCRIEWNASSQDDQLAATLRGRQTSRKKYVAGITEALAAEVTQIAAAGHMKLSKLSRPQAAQAIWLNQRAVFDDMFDEPVRQELDHWLRYTQAEKQAKKDGLAYDCMELNGRVMKYIVGHPGVLRTPGIAWLLRQYYLRTMKDESDVFYMMAPFESEKQAFDVGVIIMKIWQAIAAQGCYLHPFGTIMSNHAAHQDFLRLVQEQNESRADSYLVFIFRCGKSARPTPSLRLPYDQHLIME